jgi:hypothetical protein
MVTVRRFDDLSSEQRHVVRQNVSQGKTFTAGWDQWRYPLTGGFNSGNFDDLAIYDRRSSGVWSNHFYPATQTSTIVGWGISGDEADGTSPWLITATTR